MPVLSLNKPVISAQINTATFEYVFENQDVFQIPKSVHNRTTIRNILIIDNDNQIIYPPVFIDSALLITIESSTMISGKIIMQ